MLRKDKINANADPSDAAKASDGFLTQFEEACLVGFMIKQAPSDCVITIDCDEGLHGEQIIIINKSK